MDTGDIAMFAIVGIAVVICTVGIIRSFVRDDRDDYDWTGVTK